MIDDDDIRSILQDALIYADLRERYGLDVRSIRTFRDAGVLTLDDGLVLTLRDGSRVFLTIQVRR